MFIHIAKVMYLEKLEQYIISNGGNTYMSALHILCPESANMVTNDL
jgi:hypothetical protein